MTSGARVWAEDGCPIPKTETKTAQVPQGDMTAALSDVIAERRRQIEVEGWTPEHDDAHKEGSLGRAGGFYALNAGAAMWYGTHDTSICDTAPDGWPWAPEWWKPANARRDLVKAGALILAEIERIDRAEAAKTHPPISGD